MALINIPGILPRPVRDGFAVARTEDYIISNIEDSIIAKRNIQRNVPDTYNINFNLTEDELAIFLTFYNTTLGHGARWFNMYDPITDTFRGDFRFTAPPQYTTGSSARFNVACQVQDVMGAVFEPDFIAPIPSQRVTITNAVDNRGLNFGDLASGSTTNDDTPELEGTLSAGLGEEQTLVVFKDGTEIGVASVNATAWNFFVPNLAHNERPVFTAAVRNSQGAFGSLSASFTLFIDSAQPTIIPTIKEVNPLSSPRTVIPNGGTTEDTNLVFRFDLPQPIANGEAIRLFRNFSPSFSIANISGATSLAYTSGTLPLGEATYHIAIISSSGTIGTFSNAWTVTIIGAAEIPDLTITQGRVGADTFNSGDTIASATPIIEGTLSRPLTANQGINLLLEFYVPGGGFATNEFVQSNEITVNGTSWTYEPNNPLTEQNYALQGDVGTIGASGFPGPPFGQFSNRFEWIVDGLPVALLLQIQVITFGGVEYLSGSTIVGLKPKLIGDGTRTIEATEELQLHRNSVRIDSAANPITVTPRARDGFDWNFTPSENLDAGESRFELVVIGPNGEVVANSPVFTVFLEDAPPIPEGQLSLFSAPPIQLQIRSLDHLAIATGGVTQFRGSFPSIPTTTVNSNQRIGRILREFDNTQTHDLVFIMDTEGPSGEYAEVHMFGSFPNDAIPESITAYISDDEGNNIGVFVMANGTDGSVSGNINNRSTNFDSSQQANVPYDYDISSLSVNFTFDTGDSGEVYRYIDSNQPTAHVVQTLPQESDSITQITDHLNLPTSVFATHTDGTISIFTEGVDEVGSGPTVPSLHAGVVYRNTDFEFCPGWIRTSDSGTVRFRIRTYFLFPPGTVPRSAIVTFVSPDNLTVDESTQQITQTPHGGFTINDTVAHLNTEATSGTIFPTYMGQQQTGFFISFPDRPDLVFGMVN